MLMLPPTYLTCLEVGQHASAAAALDEASARTVDMFTPEVISVGGRLRALDAAAYQAAAGALDGELGRRELRVDRRPACWRRTPT